MSDFSLTEINERISKTSTFVDSLKEDLNQVIVGQETLINKVLICMLANGHMLLEGVPGLAKTLTVKMLARLIDTKFQRIQFTPDMLPADLLGTLIYNQKTGEFDTRKGPIFANIILADEINRSPAKVQSALLESMQERQVTLGENTFVLDAPFLVLATQNPIDQEGTYPLPEAQVDRFMLKLRITYPSMDEERQIMDAMAVTDKQFDISPTIEAEAMMRARKVVDQVYLDDKIREYILSIIFATREPEKYNLPLHDYIRYGGSPRATIHLAIASRAHAVMMGRGFVTPQDVKSIAPDVLRHRIIVTFEAEADELTSDDIIAHILNELPVP